MQLYDSAERLMNFAKYDPAGKPIFDERFAIFYPEKDTIQLMYLITGHIHDIDHRGDLTIIDIIPFQQKFYVKP